MWSEQSHSTNINPTRHILCLPAALELSHIIQLRSIFPLSRTKAHKQWPQLLGTEQAAKECRLASCFPQNCCQFDIILKPRNGRPLYRFKHVRKEEVSQLNCLLETWRQLGVASPYSAVLSFGETRNVLSGVFDVFWFETKHDCLTNVSKRIFKQVFEPNESYEPKENIK